MTFDKAPDTGVSGHPRPDLGWNVCEDPSLLTPPCDPHLCAAVLQPHPHLTRVSVGSMTADDVATGAALRLSEFTYHSWDIRVVSDLQRCWPPAAVGWLVDQLGLFVSFLGRPDALDSRRVTLAVRTTEPDRSCGLDLRDPVTLVDAAAAACRRPRCPRGGLTRMAAGRLAPQLTSDTLTRDDLRRVFPGF